MEGQIVIPFSYGVTIVSGLVAAVIALFWILIKTMKSSKSEIKVLYETFTEQQASQLQKVVTVVSENKHAHELLTDAIKGNIKSTDKIFEHLSRSKK